MEIQYIRTLEELREVNRKEGLNISEVSIVIGPVPLRKSKPSPEPATASSPPGVPSGKPGSTAPEADKV